MGDVNLEIKLSNLDERVIKIEESGGGSGGDGYITSVSNDFNVVNKKLSLSNDVTTKLSKVDTPDNLSVELEKKIDKPVSATNGQVLTYNGTTNEWEAQNSKGGSQSIISDAYNELKTYVAGEYCIYNDSLWKCLIQHNGQTPTEGTYWTKVSVANEIASVNSSLNNFIKIYSIDYSQSVSSNQYANIATLPSEYQGAKAYLVTGKFNAAYLTGGVNSSLDYSIYIFNNYTAELSFKTIDVICIM